MGDRKPAAKPNNPNKLNNDDQVMKFSLFVLLCCSFLSVKR